MKRVNVKFSVILPDNATKDEINTTKYNISEWLAFCIDHNGPMSMKSPLSKYNVECDSVVIEIEQ